MNKALIVVGIQNDITKNYKEIIDSINSAIDWAVAHEIPVVYIRCESLSRGTRTFKPNMRGSELACDLKIVSDCTFTEYKGNALTSETSSDFVRKHGVTDLYLTGVDIYACVKPTCYNLLRDRYRVTVLSGYITSYDKRKLGEMLQYYEKRGSTITTPQELQKEQADKCGSSGRM